ncbi:dTMP kinase [Deinococcus metalli]|uniref:Thymidylate kinase n=1 Tax=Deinococcus metalli TaxID=1141878 RepID=A0A7W8KMC8_9DEIO|nr:dTMP kinase [Deinococcus metalli]MBB5379274.1 dTMP kinase [Deinococcus metalli]
MDRKPEGVLVTFEGIGGSGKSSAIGRAEQWLSGGGIGVVRTREPGGTPLGERLRPLLTEKSEGHVPLHRTEAFLFEADRAQTFDEVILPALREGHVVLSDRGEYGTVAYQGYGRDLPIDLIDRMTAFATLQRRPDLALVFDLPVEVAMARRHRTPTTDRFDHERLAFQERARQGYLFAARRDGVRARVVNASRAADEVFDEVKYHIVDVLRSCNYQSQMTEQLL